MKIYFAGNLVEPREVNLKRISLERNGQLCRLASYYYMEWLEVTRKVVFGSDKNEDLLCRK